MKLQNRINEAAEKLSTTTIWMHAQASTEILAECLKDFLTNNEDDNRELIDKIIYHMGVVETLIKMVRQQYPDGLSTRMNQASDFIINELLEHEEHKEDVNDFLEEMKELCEKHGIKEVNVLKLGDDD